MTTLQDQQGDVLLFQTPDNGDVRVIDGLVQMSSGLETAAYLSLFGGNDQDDGLVDNNQTWWGNLGENRDAYEYRSETQNLLESLPATSGNLRRIEESAKRDLEWFVTENVASSVSVSASIPTLNTVKINININAVGSEASFTFIENWKAAVS